MKDPSMTMPGMSCREETRNMIKMTKSTPRAPVATQKGMYLHGEVVSALVQFGQGDGRRTMECPSAADSVCS